MKLNISKNANVNYLAKVVQIDEFNSHPDPEVTKLKCCIIDGFNIICGIDSKPGKYIYFPTSCCINPELLSYNNLYKHSELNSNPNEKGMFEENGRVKAIKLRGCISEGFILPITLFENFVLSVTNKDIYCPINTEFDSIVDGNKEFWINKKYIPTTQNSGESNKTKKEEILGFDKLIENQFNYHYDTVIIKKCPKVINPNDYIHISEKVHGTSGISAYVLCNFEKSWKDKIVDFINEHIFKLEPITITDYDYLYSSRTSIRNRYEEITPEEDVWYIADTIIRPHLDKGMTVYYEIIGFDPNGSYIQKGYDYGYIPPTEKDPYTYNKHFGIRVYRVTITNVDGKIHEFSPREVQMWAINNNLTPVKEYYYGKAKDLYPNIQNSDNWADAFITEMSNDVSFNMECDSPTCANKVPHEGVVIKIDNMKSAAFKLKCFKFLNKEQKELDNGDVNIEDNA